MYGREHDKTSNNNQGDYEKALQLVQSNEFVAYL